MNANEALRLSQENWANNEQQYLSYVVGYQSKVESAAREGRTFCNVGTVPSGKAGLLDFTASFFEQQGFYVSFQSISPDEIAININWKQEPLGSRPYKEANEFSKMINAI